MTSIKLGIASRLAALAARIAHPLVIVPVATAVALALFFATELPLWLKPALTVLLGISIFALLNRQVLLERERHRLAARQRYAIKRARHRIYELESLCRKRHEESIRDPVTGVYNYRFYQEALAKALFQSTRRGKHTSVVVFDIDNFKLLNDRFGHTAGDRVLRNLAGTVSRLVRPDDCVARTGGEEFAVVLPEIQRIDAFAVAERIRIEISKAELLTERRVTVSGGVACAPEDGTDGEDLLAKADAAMYLAKANGKNICCIYSDDVDSPDRTGGNQSLVSLLHNLAVSLDAKAGTSNHSENVARYAAAIGREVGFTEPDVANLRLAGILHDVGKIGLGEDVLHTPLGPLSPEHHVIRKHPEIGAAILENAGLSKIARWVRHHHERVDGSGYPRGLSGLSIPPHSRILLVAEAFEAMTSDRPYRKGIPATEAIEELRRNAGDQFDSTAVEALASLIELGRFRSDTSRVAEDESAGELVA